MNRNRIIFTFSLCWGLLALLAWIGGTVKAVQGGEKTAVPAAAEAPPVPEGVTIPTKDLMSIMRDGGPLMYPIALCSIIMVAFVLERAISLRHGRVIPKPFVKRFVQQLRDGELDRDQALALCEENGSPVAGVLAGAIRKWGRPSVEVEQGVIDSGERVATGLRKHLRVLNAVATISPLLGLLGTVTGMIRAFNVIAAADALGRPQLLASGISEALLTTAAGLFVAIPTMTFYMIFVSRVDRLIIEIDSLGQEVVNAVSAEELQDRKTRSAKTRRAAEMKPAA
jgi:biopolymer transport protein ExbB